MKIEAQKGQEGAEPVLFLSPHCPSNRNTNDCMDLVHIQSVLLKDTLCVRETVTLEKNSHHCACLFRLSHRAVVFKCLLLHLLK